MFVFIGKPVKCKFVYCFFCSVFMRILLYAQLLPTVRGRHIGAGQILPTGMLVLFAYVLKLCLLSYFLFFSVTVFCCTKCNRSCLGSANIYKAREYTYISLHIYMNELGNWHVHSHAHFSVSHSGWQGERLFKRKSNRNEVNKRRKQKVSTNWNCL